MHTHAVTPWALVEEVTDRHITRKKEAEEPKELALVSRDGKHMCSVTVLLKSDATCSPKAHHIDICRFPCNCIKMCDFERGNSVCHLSLSLTIWLIYCSLFSITKNLQERSTVTKWMPCRMSLCGKRREEKYAHSWHRGAQQIHTHGSRISARKGECPSLFTHGDTEHIVGSSGLHVCSKLQNPIQLCELWRTREEGSYT